MCDGPEPVSAQQRTAARIAGASYLISTAAVIYANFGLRGPLVFARDPALTILRISQEQGAFRASILLDIAYCGGVTIGVASLYVLLQGTNRYLALIAASLRWVSLGTAVLTAITFFHVSRLVSMANGPAAAPAEQVQSAVRFALADTHDQYYLGLVFWAFSTTAFAWLWHRSRYVAPWFARAGIAAGLWCAFCTIAYLRDPAYAQTVSLWWFDVPMAAFDASLSVLLLTRGLPRSNP